MTTDVGDLVTLLPTERWDAGGLVSHGAPPGDGTALLEALRDEVGWVVGGVDWVVRTLTGHDLVAEVVEPFAGDFGAISSMQQGWRAASSALGAVGDNHAGLAADLPAFWEGAAEQAAARSLGELVDTSATQAEAAALVAEQLGHVLEVSLAAAETVCAALALVDDIAVSLALKLATGPVGAALSTVTLPAEAARLLDAVRRAEAAVERVVEVVGACLEAARTIATVLDLAAVTLEAVAVAQHARAASRADDVAAAGFDRA